MSKNKHRDDCIGCAIRTLIRDYFVDNHTTEDHADVIRHIADIVADLTCALPEEVLWAFVARIKESQIYSLQQMKKETSNYVQ